MQKCYIAIKLDALDALRGQIPGIEDRYPCAECDTHESAMEYLKKTSARSEYPALVEKLGIPDVDIVLVCDAKYPIPKGSHPTTTACLSQYGGEPAITSKLAVIHADNVFPSTTLTAGEVDELSEIMSFRMDANAQLDMAQQRYPTCAGLTEWFQRIADQVYRDTFPPVGIHLQSYAETFYAIRETNPQLSQEFVILKAAKLAAEQVANSHPEWADEFNGLANEAALSLQHRCAQELVFFEPNEYLTRILPQVPQQYQESFLNAFNETLANVQENHPELTTEQQAAAAMDQTIYLMENSIIDKQMDGVFGNGPKLSREEYLELDSAKKTFIEMRAVAHINVDIINKMVDELREHDDWSVEEHDFDG